MGKSLFRLVDVLELCTAYLIYFSSNLLFDYVKTLNLDSYILKAFLKNIMDHQTIIIFLLTFIVIIFHYQMLHRKKTEVYCRILVGDTLLNITIRYALNCLTILGVIYLLSIVIDVYFSFNLISNLYLVCIFIIYILISASWVRKYENF
ncbi:magnesium-transporting ATPase (P-type) [Oikeobacillus pervagus]|uniref:Magnesium-transporting ATPase (P-type) n=1 Tax=Oikeobacillus pervagus TaxID=1325931 RepID=A0AAJ1WIE2_9BACI|nr:magnesium-transporting ATPase (P-type) [Oikeobacillus pervagus]